MTTTDVSPYASGVSMLEALRSKKISAAELLEMHLERIERYNPTLNVIVTKDYENARETAKAADEALARGDEGAMLGLPTTIKDCILVKGLVATAGVEPWADYVPEVDAPIVTSVKEAGAVIMAKTNLPVMAMDWQAYNPLFGRTNNPYNLGRTPGGSTGGSAAVAAGMTPIEWGNDLGGSVRVPAAFCGIYGHRPSETAIPKSGGFPLSYLPDASSLMAVQGPLARTAEDLALAFDVVAGPEALEDVAWKLEIPPARHENLADYRVAILPRVPWLEVDDETMAASEELASKLSKAGATVKEAQPELFGDLRRHHQLYVSMLTGLFTTGSTEEERKISIAFNEMTHGYEDFDDAAERGINANPYDISELVHGREEFRHSYAEFFKDWDVLLAPNHLGPAFPHDESPRKERTFDINGKKVPYGLGLVYPALCNFTGMPGTAFPVGLNSSGLPLSLQAIGPYLEDHTGMRFTGLVAQEFGGFQAPPGFE